MAGPEWGGSATYLTLPESRPMKTVAAPDIYFSVEYVFTITVRTIVGVAGIV